MSVVDVFNEYLPDLMRQKEERVKDRKNNNNVFNINENKSTNNTSVLADILAPGQSEITDLNAYRKEKTTKNYNITQINQANFQVKINKIFWMKSSANDDII